MTEIATWIFMIDDKISQRTHSVAFFFSAAGIQIEFCTQFF